MKRLVLVVAIALAAGCAAPHRVTDTKTGKVYYTKRVNRRIGGGITFTDVKTGAKVTLQDSEVERVSKRDFNEGTK